MVVPKSRRIVPGAAFLGSVAPMASRHLAMAPSASMTMAKILPELMKAFSSPKRGGVSWRARRGFGEGWEPGGAGPPALPRGCPCPPQETRAGGAHAAPRARSLPGDQADTRFLPFGFKRYEATLFAFPADFADQD